MNASADASDTPVIDRLEELLEQAAIDVPVREWFGWVDLHPALQVLIVSGMVLTLAWFGHLVGRRYLLRVVDLIAARAPTWWAREVTEHQVFERLVPVIPIVIINRGVLLVPHLAPAMVEFVQRLMLATLAIVLVRTFGALLNAVHAIYNRYPIAQGRPIKGYVQVVKLLAYLFAAFMVIAALANQSPWYFISGLGAMTAIIILVFRETILSFVAGIQLVNNDLVRVGDWIEMPQFDADGDVIDIALNVVRVQNWDRTFTVIPTHKFLEHSFRNYRGMRDSGGRRISRTIHLDLATVRFLTDGEIERFRRFRLLRDYIDHKEAELAEWNESHCASDERDVVVNTRHLTNLGTFRAYALRYLETHPSIHQDRILMVRQMEPTPQGVGMQIYGFTTDTRWPQYEAIQGDIFDHLLAVVPEFGLRVYQQPSGHDVLALRPLLQPDTAGHSGST